MADGPKPCADCGHDAASHYASETYDYTVGRTVRVVGMCLARGCDECQFWVDKPTPKRSRVRT